MTGRTIRSVVHVSSAFSFAGLDAPQPAGDYHIDRDEESIEGISQLAWVRTNTFIHLPAIGAQSPKQQMARIDAADLEAALEKDRQS